MEQRKCISRGRPSMGGFTLIELMVVVAIIAIISAIATPSMKNLMVSNKVKSSINDWTLAMQTARSEAVRQRVPVSVCPSADGVACDVSASYTDGWMVVVENSNGDGTIVKILQDFPKLSGVTMTADLTSGTMGRVTYLANGLPTGGFVGFNITVMEDATTPDSSLTRYICVARTGRSRVLKEVCP